MSTMNNVYYNSIHYYHSSASSSAAGVAGTTTAGSELEEDDPALGPWLMKARISSSSIKISSTSSYTRE